MTFDISEFVTAVHANAVAKGFWSPPQPSGASIALIHSPKPAQEGGTAA